MLREDFRSTTWKRLTQLLQERLEALRESNDYLSNGPEKTAAIRGQIAEVKRILSLEESLGASATPDPFGGGTQPQAMPDHEAA